MQFARIDDTSPYACRWLLSLFVCLCALVSASDSIRQSFDMCLMLDIFFFRCQRMYQLFIHIQLSLLLSFYSSIRCSLLGIVTMIRTVVKSEIDYISHHCIQSMCMPLHDSFVDTIDTVHTLFRFSQAFHQQREFHQKHRITCTYTMEQQQQLHQH